MLKIKLFECGNSYQSGWLACRTQKLSKTRFPALVVAIKHPTQGVVLFDTGYGRNLAYQLGRFPQNLYLHLLSPEIADSQTAVNQLADEGISSNDVKTIIVSHTHPDHIGGLIDFPNANIVAGPGAFPSPLVATKSHWHQQFHGVFDQLFPGDIQARLVPLNPSEPNAWSPSGVATDLFGDGSVLLFDLPGHAPGQLGVVLPETQIGACVLAADACWHRAALAGSLPAWPTRFLTSDYGSYRRTIELLADYQRKNPDAWILPSHCSTSIEMVQDAIARVQCDD